MSRDESQSKKRKVAPTAAGHANAKKGKGKAVEVDDDDTLDDLPALRARNATLRSQLADLSTVFDELQHLRHTGAEAKYDELKRSAQDLEESLNRALATAKDETKQLKAQLAERSAQPAAATPAARSTSPPIAASQARGKGKSKDASPEAIQEAYDRGKAAGAQDGITALEGEVKELQTKYAQAQRELARAKKAGGGAGQEAASDKLELLSDLSGFVILDSKPYPDEEGAIKRYDCLLSDLKGTGLTVQFQLTTWEDESWTYQPNLDQADERLLEALDGKHAVFRSFMRFNKAQLSNFARRLLVCINGFGR